MSTGGYDPNLLPGLTTTSGGSIGGAPCPACGYCPCCGRRNAQPFTVTPWWPHNPDVTGPVPQPIVYPTIIRNDLRYGDTSGCAVMPDVVYGAWS